MDTLSQFLYRLCFGLAVGMMATPPRHVPSGYFRVHSLVLLGMAVLALILGWSYSLPWIPPLVMLAASYASAVCWFLHCGPAGMASLLTAACGALAGSLSSAGTTYAVGFGSLYAWPVALDAVTSGLVLGFTLNAMFLGHWYLNAPGMELRPLRRSILLMGAAVVARGLACGGGLVAWAGTDHAITLPWPMLVLRWSAGFVGTLLVAAMAWKSLDVPNTQSATGILYVGVITTFLGELTSMLLSRGLPFAV